MILVSSLLSVACAVAPAGTGSALACPAPVVPLLPLPQPDEELTELLDVALQAVDRGHLDLADLVVGRALQAAPDAVEAHIIQAVVRMAQGRPADAAVILERADALLPDQATTLALLARVRFEVEGPAAALPTLQRVVELEPGRPSHWANLGLVALELGSTGSAHRAFLEAVALDTGCAPAHRGLGRLYMLTGELDLARRAWTTALELEPDDASAWLALGHVERGLGAPSEARRAYHRAHGLRPEDSWIGLNLGMLLIALERPDEARPLLHEAVVGLQGSDLEQAMALTSLAGCLARVGDLDGAEDAYEEALALQDGLGEAWLGLGLLRLDRGRGAQARPALQAAHDLGWLSPGLVVELVLLHEGAGDREAAAACAVDLLDDREGGPAVGVSQAELLLRSRDPRRRDAAAAEALLVELLHGPLARNGRGWALLGEAHAQQGALTEAVEALDRALRVADARTAGRMGWRARREQLAQRLEER